MNEPYCAVFLDQPLHQALAISASYPGGNPQR